MQYLDHGARTQIINAELTILPAFSELSTK